MIKFFRKIRKQLVTENKTRKYFKYAIGEIILVVIGILIALQINNWNENRIRLKKETTILAGIHNEFVKNKIQLDSVVKEHKVAYNNTAKIIKFFPIQEKPDDKTLDSLSHYLYYSYAGLTFDPLQSSIHALTSTSSFDIISNETLRNHLMSWNDLVQDYKEEETSARVYTRNHYDVYLSKHFEFNFDFNDSRNDFKALQSLEFEFKVRNMNDFMEQILFSSGELQILQTILDEIIELSKPNASK